MLARWKSWARGLKRECLTMLIALRDPRTPWHAKILGVCVVAYALSPIDLIPDAIPVLGYLDDLIIVPVGIWFVRRLIPAEVLIESRVNAASGDRPVSRMGYVAAAFIVLLWVVSVMAMGWAGYHFLTK